MSLPAGRRRTAALFVALAALVAALTIAPTANNDIFLHLSTGRIVLETGRVPHLDDYSALARGRPFVAHEWLAGVIFRLVEMAAGLDGLVLFKAAVSLLLALALYAAARSLGGSPAAAAAGLAFVLVLAAARLMERPHLFSYLLMAIVLWLLARRRAGRKAPLLILPGLQVAWANLHGGFVLGPLIVALAAAGEGIEALGAALAPAAGAGTSGARERAREAARLAILVPVLVAACLVNPYGLALLRFPFELTGSSFMSEIYEWQPPFASDFASTYMARYYVVWIAVGIGVFTGALLLAWRRGGTIPGGAFPLLLFAAFLALSLRMQRNVTDFALATFPGIAAAASWIADARGDRRPPAGRGTGPRRDGAAVPLVAAALLILAGWFAVHGYPFRPGSRRPFGFGVGRNVPVAAADYLQDNGIRGNAFNTYSVGAYLVYRFYPEVRVGMDSRNDVYGEALYRDYTQALEDSAALARMLDRIEARFAFIEWGNPRGAAGLATLRRLGGWDLVAFDDAVEVWLRPDGPYAAAAARDRFTLLDPALYRPGSIPPTRAAAALLEAERAVRSGRGAFIARVMRADALLAAGRIDEAMVEEGRIAADRPPFGYLYTYLGSLRLAAGQREVAAIRFREALRRNAGDRVAAEGLARALGRP